MTRVGKIEKMSDTRKIGNLWLFQFAADFSAIVAAYYTILLIRFHWTWGEKFFQAAKTILGPPGMGSPGEWHESFYIVNAPRIIFFLTITLCVLYALCDMYPGRRFIRKRAAAWNAIVANTAAIALFYTYFYLRRNVFHPRSFFATLLFVNVIYCVAFRAMMDRFLEYVRTRFNMDKWSAILIGSDDEAGFVSILMEEVHPHGIHIADQIKYNPDKPFEELMKTVEDDIRRCNADMIIVADKRLYVAQIMQLLELAERLNITVKVLSDKMNVLRNQAGLPVDTIAGVPLVHFEAPSIAGRRAGLRRVASLVLAGAAMTVVLPAMGLIALLIRLTSKGPAFFVQERIGVNRKSFRMYKFRTMHEHADELQAQVEEFNESRGGLFKIRKDPRVTPVGRFLRRFSLDELPQFINVLRGEMTIVGPRPLPRRDFENYYEEWHYSRHSGMPGLTCLWQVSGRSEIDFHNMCILDVYYLRNRNWVLDLKILLRTAWVVLFARGAY